MAPMPIHTVAPDKTEYVRVIGGFDSPANEYLNEVGIVLSFADLDEGGTLIFVDIGHVEGIKVFNVGDIEYIDKKEYFKGRLGG